MATTHPDLAAQWHPTKNELISPFDVSAGSDKIVWWQCDCGHVWKSRVANRSHGQGCPICKNKTISDKVSKIHIERSGSLEETYPELAKEWHYDKNEGLLPSQLTASSTRVVWWHGSCGHEWRASPSNRSRGTNCPYCGNQKLLEGFNDLETLYPDIAQEWHPSMNEGLLPTNVLGSSNKKAWWQGNCGHVWQQGISNRTKRQQGCPICAKRLQTSFPEQSLFYYIKKVVPDAINSYKEIFDNQMELDIFIPSLNIGIEYDGINWHGDQKSIKREQEKYSICGKNKIKLIRVKENPENIPSGTCDMIVAAKRHPTHKELDSTIQSVLKILKYVVDVDTEKDALTIRENYLGAIANKSLMVCRPDIAATWHPTRNGNLTPDMFTEHSGIKVWWLCSACGNEWQSAIASRSAGVGCKLCGYKKRAASRIKNRMAREGSLSDNNIQLAEEWHPTRNDGLLPTDVMRSSGVSVWWQCSTCGHEWKAKVNSRANGSGCPNCVKCKQKLYTQNESVPEE